MRETLGSNSRGLDRGSFKTEAVLKGIIPKSPTESPVDQLTGFITRREETLQAIGTGNIKYGQPWEQKNPVSKRAGRGGDGMDATLKIVSAKKAVEGSVEKYSRELAEVYGNELTDKQSRLDKIRDATEAGYVPQDVYRLHEREVALFEILPDENPTLKKGLVVYEANQVPVDTNSGAEKVSKEKKPGITGRERLSPTDTEFTLPTGETFYGKHGDVLKMIYGKEGPYMDSDTLASKVWEGSNLPIHRVHGQLRLKINQIKAGLEGTNWELVGKKGIHGGYKLAERES